jgi:hypothetical protein
MREEQAAEPRAEEGAAQAREEGVALREAWPGREGLRCTGWPPLLLKVREPRLPWLE